MSTPDPSFGETSDRYDEDDSLSGFAAHRTGLAAAESLDLSVPVDVANLIPVRRRSTAYVQLRTDITAGTLTIAIVFYNRDGTFSHHAELAMLTGLQVSGGAGNRFLSDIAEPFDVAGAFQFEVRVIVAIGVAASADIHAWVA